MSIKSPDWVIDEASKDSFPASDPPAWGSSHAAPSESTVLPPELLTGKRKKYLMRIGLGVLGAGILVASVFAIRYWRRR